MSQNTEGEGEFQITVKESDKIELIQHPRAGQFRITRQNEAANGRRPAYHPGREGSPIDPAEIPEVTMRLVQLAELQPHPSNKEKVRNHHTHYGSEEDGEG